MAKLNIYGPDGTVVRSVNAIDPTFFSGGVLSGGGSLAEQKAMNQPYRFHTWVYVCAHNIAQKLSSIPHVMRSYDPATKEEVVSYDHEVVKLFNNPNPYMSKSAFWEAIVLALMLPTKNGPGGQAFIIPESGEKGKKVNLRKGEMPKELYPFSDNTVEAWRDPATKEHLGWTLHLPNKTKINYEFDELIRVYLFNPYDLTKGLCPLEAARIAIQQDIRADEYNSRSFENDGQIGGILSSDQPLTKDQREEMLNAWMQTYGGPANARGIAVLGAGLSYEQFAKSQQDMQFIQQKGLNKDQIFAAYGLNELAVGQLKGVPYSNVKEGRKYLWTDTYIPYQNTIWEAINFAWVGHMDRGQWEADSDWSTVEALRDDYMEKAKVAAQLVQQTYLPPAEAFRLFEIPVDIDKYPHLESAYANAMLVDVTQGPPPGIAPSPMGASAEPKVRVVQDELDAISEEYISVVLAVGEKGFRETMTKYFYTQKREMQDKVDEWLKMNRGQTLQESNKLTIVDPKVFLFDMVKENEKLLGLYKPMVKGQMERETAKVSSELNGLVNWNVNPEEITAMVGKRAKFVKGINTSTFRTANGKISELVAQAVDEHWTTEQLAKELKKGIYEVAEIRVNNAKTIARTEIGSVSSSTRWQIFNDEGVEYQKWITARDDRVRPTHAAENGEVINVGDRFPHTGLLYPRENGGAPEEVINCRCVAISVREK